MHGHLWKIKRVEAVARTANRYFAKFPLETRELTEL